MPCCTEYRSEDVVRGPGELSEGMDAALCQGLLRPRPNAAHRADGQRREKGFFGAGDDRGEACAVYLVRLLSSQLFCCIQVLSST